MSSIYFAAIDQGTTSTKFLLVNEIGDVEICIKRLHKQHLPREEWIEHSPIEIIENINNMMQEGYNEMKLKEIPLSSVKCMGITNQRETALAWNKVTGYPFYNAIVWSDNRTANYIDEMHRLIVEKYGENWIREKTGLRLSTYFSASKYRWLLDNVVECQEALNKNEAVFGTMDSWLLYNLCGKELATDITNASRTLLMNIHTGKWDEDLCKIFEIPPIALLPIRPNSYKYGVINEGPFKGIPVTGMIGDQQSSLFAQCLMQNGRLKCTYGTGCFILQNIGSEFKLANKESGIFTTVAYQIGCNVEENQRNKTGAIHYAFEGSIQSAGSAIRYFIDQIQLFINENEIDDLASTVASTGSLVFLPAFNGLYAPYWRPEMKACLDGITFNTTKAHIARSIYESICLQVYDMLIEFNKQAITTISMLNVDGGITKSDCCMQLQSDLLDRFEIQEATAIGAIMVASYYFGYAFGNGDILSKCIKVNAFSPQAFAQPHESMDYLYKLKKKWNCKIKQISN